MYFFILLLASYGLAILLVEFANKWPIKPVQLFLKTLVHDYIHWKAAQVFDCTVCMSFWATLIVEIPLFFIFGYFLWPISGFATAGFTWTVIQALNVLDRGE
tara:strand:- start:554 stop:859 length:306 start_codon:yes stop_codon:yes gene_type:complete